MTVEQPLKTYRLSLNWPYFSFTQSNSALTITAVTVVCWTFALALAFFHKTSGMRTDLGGVIAMLFTLRL